MDDKMINWVEFCMKNHLSLNSVKDLSVLLVKYLPSFYNDYTHLLDYVYQDSSLAQFIMPYVVCGACKKPFFLQTQFSVLNAHNLSFHHVQDVILIRLIILLILKRGVITLIE